MTDFYKQLERPLQEGEWPFLEIVCEGNSTNGQHGKTIVANFFDSRFEDLTAFGVSLPRLDLPNASPDSEFTWDCYRLDIGSTNIVRAKGLVEYPRAATGYKSGETIWDSKNFVQLECRKRLPAIGRNGEEIKKTCCKKIRITRAEWNQIGEFLITQKQIQQGDRTAQVNLRFILGLLDRVRRANNSR